MSLINVLHLRVQQNKLSCCIFQLITVLFITYSGLAHADQDALRITIGYLPETEKAGQNTTVIEREEILCFAQASVIDVFRQIPGVHVEQAGTAGSVASVYIRGADPNFTIVLIDGVRVNDPTNSRGGSFDFSALALDEIESIEISRSALSSIYGSNALSGVISITTRAKRTGGQVNIQTGSQGYGTSSASYTHNNEFIDAGIALHHNNEGSDRPGQRSRRDVARLFYRQRFLDAHIIDVQTRYSENDYESFPDDSGGQRFSILNERDNRENRATTFSLRYEYKPQSPWQFYIGYDYFQQDEEFDSPGVAPGLRDPFGIPRNAFDNDYQREQYLAYITHKPSDSLEFVAGFEYNEENGSSRGLVDFGAFQLPTDFSLVRDNHAAFVELRYNLTEHFYLQGALRVDDPEDFSSQTSTSISLNYELPSVYVFMKYNEGFKLPSFFALGHPLVGNPALRPEEAHNGELGAILSFENANATLSFSLFRNEISNLVDLQETPVLQLVNRDEVILQGGEVSLDYPLQQNLDASMYVNYLDADIRNSDEVLRNRPRWRAGLTLAWRASSATTATTRVEHVGTVSDSSVPTGDVDLGAYTRVDASIRHQLDGRISISAAIDNLLNTHYETAVGFSGQSRRLRAGLNINF